ncbi:hypothetical protein PPGU19_098370 (plasmid) [Paraburkholderia sp. PGU19]|uniref:hypothetical protein n=1 Tax=Paraburkholderia sp. PGU19 TaxID=2735434 RepID=UPI0015DCF45C|nr:hypothetical protein [Paraburkholderia sp. PGU19]BCG05269.1 hypothetical protein PPGU19_098370 [Paraburkholderia sp. PGU19]
MSVRFQFALLARGRTEVLKGIARMHELCLKRQAEAFLLGKALGLVALPAG